MAETILYEARGAVAPQAACDITVATEEAVSGEPAAPETALDIGTLIEGEGMPTKRRFPEIARSDRLRTALAWRAACAAATGQRGAEALEPASGKAHLPNVT